MNTTPAPIPTTPANSDGHKAPIVPRKAPPGMLPPIDATLAVAVTELLGTQAGPMLLSDMVRHFQGNGVRPAFVERVTNYLAGSGWVKLSLDSERRITITLTPRPPAASVVPTPGTNNKGRQYGWDVFHGFTAPVAALINDLGPKHARKGYGARWRCFGTFRRELAKLTDPHGDEFARAVTAYLSEVEG